METKKIKNETKKYSALFLSDGSSKFISIHSFFLRNGEVTLFIYGLGGSGMKPLVSSIEFQIGLVLPLKIQRLFGQAKLVGHQTQKEPP
jgi:hypothetical protein